MVTYTLAAAYTDDAYPVFREERAAIDQMPCDYAWAVQTWRVVPSVISKTFSHSPKVCCDSKPVQLQLSDSIS